MIREAHGARDALFPHPMLPRLEYFTDQADDEDEETRMLREGRLVDDADDDPLVDTRLMPAKHGAKSPTLAAHGRPVVPSPYPSAPKQYASGVQRKAAPSQPEALPDARPIPPLFADLDACVESTGSDVHAPIHRFDGASPIPSTAALAARRGPWSVRVTPPEFQPLPMPTFDPPNARLDRRESETAPSAQSKFASEKSEKKSQRASAIFGGLLGILCGALMVSIANGTITQKDARSALARATHVVDAVLAHH